ncbi:hypothetical protein ASG04_10980 [Curtobacterium sp. Leaf183]|nr:hypothetical protein ASG04_10980 [Curtobacterium sp. Leaf183]
MITCEHCGSVLPDGAIFCGECGRAVNTAANRRAVAPEPVDRGTPPPLQQPDQHGRRQDPATEAWLPESTLDPATRAWLTGEDRRRSGPVEPVPVQTPDSFAPRSAPTHVHGAGSGLGAWTTGPAEQPPVAAGQAQQLPAEPPLDPDSFPAEPIAPEDDPEITRLAQRSGPPAAQPPGPSRDDAAPFWAPAQQTLAPTPSTPSWWIGRAGDETATTASEPDVAAVAASDAPVALVPPADDTAGDSARADASAPTDDSGRADAATQTGATAQAGEPEGLASPAAGPQLANEAPRPGDTVAVEPLVDRRPPRPTPLVQPGTHLTTCHVCGHQLEPDDIFCNECGAVRPAVTAAFTGPVVPLPVARPDWAARSATDELDAEETGADETSTDETDADETGADETGRGEIDVDETGMVESGPGESSGVDQDQDQDHDQDMLRVPPMPESPTAPSSTPGGDDQAPSAPTSAPLPPIPGVTGPVLPVPGAATVPSSSDADESAQLDEDDEDVDETRIVTKTPTRAPFVLHCSTGEQLGVHGTGLLGRLPRPQPGERFDDLLTIHDPGKSVSKTHLEIGRDGDDLWVSDRFSGNGSVIRHIDGSIRRCEPGRRYRVERGARVDIGEQFFLLQ